MASEQLLMKGDVFKDEILAGSECTNNPAEEVPESKDHGTDLNPTCRIELSLSY